MEFFYEYGLFLAQAATVVVAILAVVVVVMALGQKQRHGPQGHIEVRKLNDKYRDLGDKIREATEDGALVKAELKARKKAEKALAKAGKKRAKKSGEADAERRPRLFVLDFHGDLKAGATDHLREEISALLPQAQAGDEVLLRLESPGGLVHGYGLAASQLQRICDAGVRLVVAVDKVAASGGYMMACVADRIVAAPFAVIGSIGVLAQLPNFNRLLKKHDIDFELLTAGEYKRTLSLFGENTEKGREKFIEELEETHELFKQHVGEHRAGLDMAKIATGEVWYGRQAVDLGLVDELQTSDGYLQQRLPDWDVFELKYELKKNWQEKLGMAVESGVERAALKLWQRSVERKTY